MDLSLLKKINDFEWQIPQHGKMLVPGVIFASEQLILDMDMKVYEQLSNVATLPGIVSAAYAMPDAIGGMVFRLAVSLLLIRMMEGLFQQVAWVLIFHAE